MIQQFSRLRRKNFDLFFLLNRKRIIHFYPSNKRHLVLILCGGIHLRRIEYPLSARYRLAVQQNLLHSEGIGEHTYNAALNTDHLVLQDHYRTAVFNYLIYVSPHITAAVMYIGKNRAVFTDKMRYQIPLHIPCFLKGRARNIVMKLVVPSGEISPFRLPADRQTALIRRIGGAHEKRVVDSHR